MTTAIDLNFLLKDLDGKEVEGFNAGKLLSAQLVSVPQGNIVKHMDWALALHRGQKIDVDNADLEYLKKFVNDSGSLSILAKHQILEKLKPDN